MPQPSGDETAGRLSARLWWALAACVVLGLGLRAIEAHHKSLWLDEYHSLYLADSESLGEVVEKVASDFRPPVFFWGLSFLRGVEPHVQRWVPILFSLLTLLPLWSIARHGGLSVIARIAVCGLFLFVPYQVQYGVDLRSYSAVQFVSATLVWAAVTSTASTRARLLTFGLATAAGLYLHYGVAVAVVCVGFARCVLRPVGAVGLPGLVAAGTLGVLTFLPWAISVEGWLFSDPEQILPPSERGAQEAAPETPALPADVTWKAALVLPRTLVPAMGLLGPSVAPTTKLATSILFSLIILGLFNNLWRYRRGTVDGNKALYAALLASGAGFAVTTALCVVLWRRVPMQYFVVASWGWPLLVGLLVQAAARRRGRAAAAVIGVTLLCGVCQVLGAPREDTEGGVRAALARGSTRDAIYTAVLWQPPWYPHTLPWTYSTGDLRGLPLDVREPHDVPDGDQSSRAVVVVTRKARPQGMHVQAGVWDSIRRHRRLVEIVVIDGSTRVYVYEPR